MAEGDAMRIAVLMLFLVVFLLVPGEAWLSGWQYRKEITITEQSGSTLTDYPVLLTIDTASLISEGKMRSDCGDIRFTDENDTLLTYYLESACNTANTKIWVKVPSIPASSSTTIYMYYGNSEAESASDIHGKWNIYDDFDGTSLNTSIWDSYTDGGSISVSNGQLILTTNNNGEARIATKEVINYTYVYEVKLDYTDANSGDDSHLQFWYATTDISDSTYSYGRYWFYYAKYYMAGIDAFSGTFSPPMVYKIVVKLSLIHI